MPEEDRTEYIDDILSDDESVIWDADNQTASESEVFDLLSDLTDEE